MYTVIIQFVSDSKAVVGGVKQSRKNIEKNKAVDTFQKGTGNYKTPLQKKKGSYLQTIAIKYVLFAVTV